MLLTVFAVSGHREETRNYFDWHQSTRKEELRELTDSKTVDQSVQ